MLDESGRPVQKSDVCHVFANMSFCANAFRDDTNILFLNYMSKFKHVFKNVYKKFSVFLIFFSLKQCKN